MEKNIENVIYIVSKTKTRLFQLLSHIGINCKYIVNGSDHYMCKFSGYEKHQVCPQTRKPLQATGVWKNPAVCFPHHKQTGSNTPVVVPSFSRMMSCK